ncbi:MAG: ParB/RepB/Spo0J family partition protein [Bacteroidales bacterium]|nr:ParB/RepB/Spo0J family partition protein [Bacteroidales bacterium]
MATKKQGGLGRGLGSILPDIEIEATQAGATLTATITTVKVADIEPNPYQPRKEFDPQALDELAQSIRQQGVISPITVRRMANGKYQLIAGERRCRAAQLAGLDDVPAYIRIATDSQAMEMALVENIQRENLNAMEVALSYNALIEECRLTHEQLSERVGKNRSTITNYLRLLTLPAETQLALSNDQITMGHARALTAIEDPEQHLAILHQIISRQLSVHQAEQMVKAAKAQPVHVSTKEKLPANYAAAQNRLKEQLQATVDIKRSRRGKGTITIAYNSDSDFERLIELLTSKL